MIFSLVKRQKLSILFDFVFFVILEAWHNKYIIFKQEFKNILSTWKMQREPDIELIKL